MKFTPEDNGNPILDVPFYDEARAADGWQGQSTTRSFNTLKSDLANTIARLGGVVHRIQRGSYEIGGLAREGAQVHYSIEGWDGQMIYGRIDVAALPIKKQSQRSGWQQRLRKKQEQSLCMALYNVIEALRAQWVLKQLNPSYVPLMPWLLNRENQTVSEAYLEAGINKALPAPEQGEFVEGEAREVD